MSFLKDKKILFEEILVEAILNFKKKLVENHKITHSKQVQIGKADLQM